MREIIFRFYDKSDKKMKRFNFSEMCYKGIWDLFPTIKEFYPDELMQYTGLKDKNGKEIYEGDIVRGGERIRQVKFSNQNASFYLGSSEKGRSFYKEFIECGQSQSDGPVHCDTIEIIGNIYENPELLNSDKNPEECDATKKH